MQFKYLLISFIPIAVVSILIAKIGFQEQPWQFLFVLLIAYIIFRMSVAIVRLTNFSLWARKAGEIEIEFIENFKKKNPHESAKLGLDDIQIYYLYHYYSLKRLVKS